MSRASEAVSDKVCVAEHQLGDGGLFTLLTKECYHPTMKDENGGPLIDMRKLQEKMLMHAEKLVQESAERLEFWRQEAAHYGGVLDTECQAIAKVMESSAEQKKEYTKMLRTFRSNVVSEVANIRKPLEDLREFFMGRTHDEEIRRLTEFVDLCERLKVLRDSGFLDDVADTMLKLSSGGNGDG